MDDLHGIDGSLRSIRLDASDAPRVKTLSLDKMFSRAHAWSVPSRAGPSVLRPPSPLRKRPIHPLPRPLEGTSVSPLAGLFDYPELIPHVLCEFEHPREMAVLCRVSRTFDYLVRKRLYEHVWVRPWEEKCNVKLLLLFESLSGAPHLCRLIKRLDVRFFPLATRGGDRYDLDAQVRSAISNMTNLEHLVWTRDKSLHPELLEEISRLPHLQTLELSGHSHRYYNPRLIGTIPQLQDIRFMMPDSDVRDCLVPIVRELDERPGGGLRGLGLICRDSPLLDDTMLKNLSVHLRHLRRLSMWGCSRVTRAGLFELLQEAEDLEELSIDALTHSGILDLSAAPEMPNLHTFSLSITAPHRTPLYITTDDLPRLPPLGQLSSLHLTLSGARAHIPVGGVEHLISQTDFSQLKRLSLLNLVVSAPQLDNILAAAPNLEDLYISTNGKQTLFECKGLSGRSLRIFHVTALEKWGPTSEDLAEIATKLPEVEQIGTGNRVYEVHRTEGGSVELARWGKTTVPGYFQVWRG